MREALDQWDYVVAAYAVAVGGTMALTLWSWLTMKRAERRRDVSRGQ
jgi:hypothetical protein